MFLVSATPPSNNVPVLSELAGFTQNGEPGRAGSGRPPGPQAFSCGYPPTRLASLLPCACCCEKRVCVFAPVALARCHWRVAALAPHQRHRACGDVALSEPWISTQLVGSTQVPRSPFHLARTRPALRSGACFTPIAWWGHRALGPGERVGLYRRVG